MASQQAYHAYAQNKGTLVPGQSISVNKFTVQVERYLSQGGFAHVYLVRTATPVYNTTHHVLKRIAVANEAMLTEVKKEVDIMRLLKGHPNIVHLIDAAWHKMPDGKYEVFILMEYCPGGGIIDMMNRRLRERLSEAEILQIFVDVCEGVAYMHNSRPSLLHRDLKVENILQSSPTSFKLCDFGSATAVSRPPSNTQEIRALETELNRHTTLQYRAPEMVDLYLRRPVDEKSDVWALGVLLYKLCYYTTPFEEHGPLAILNVQYRIPPYPVYSEQMNSLIASMLQELGAQRPTVAELLIRVHGLRGTKSSYHYPIPAPQMLSPRALTSIENTVTYSSPAVPGTSNTAPSSVTTTVMPSQGLLPKNQGVQAREKVLEAIAPLRRGRPAKDSPSSSRTSSPQKNAMGPKVKVDYVKDWASSRFTTEEDKQWKAKIDQSNISGKSGTSSEAWKFDNAHPNREGSKSSAGFGDDFAEKLWKSSNPNSTTPSHSQPTLATQIPASSSRLSTRPIHSHAHTGSDYLPGRQGQGGLKRDKDAFDGLGFTSSNEKPAPTLAEARKLRTGLAMMSTNVNVSGYNRYENTDGAPLRPSPSPRLFNNSQLQPQSASPVPIKPIASGSSWQRPSSNQSVVKGIQSPIDGGSAETRFPSVEELDATFSPSYSAPSSTHSQALGSTETPPQLPPRPSNVPKPQLLRVDPREGSRSQQVTGSAMYDSKRETSRFEGVVGNSTESKVPIQAQDLESRPSLVRRHRSSIVIKSSHDSSNSTTFKNTQPSLVSNYLIPPSTSRPPLQSASKDWLTGDDEEHPAAPAEVPVIRESPSKRASLIEKSDLVIQEATVAQQGHAPSPPHPTVTEVPEISPTVSRFTRNFPPIDTSDAQKDARNAETLTDNWSPVALATRFNGKERQPVESASSAEDDEPEDASRLITNAAMTAQNSRARRKGRQSSVHDLVDLWGGGLSAKEKEHTKSPLFEKKTFPTSKPTPTPFSSEASSTRQRSTPSKRSPTSPVHGRRSPPKNIEPRSQNSGGPTLTSVASRSRPQSMFIFPSKSTDSTTTPSVIPPPEESKSRTRRTSISDMVQRYEAIGNPGKAPAASPGSLPVQKPFSARDKLPTNRSVPLEARRGVSNHSLDSPNEGGDSEKNRNMFNVVPQPLEQAPVPSRRTSPTRRPESRTAKVEDHIPRSHKPSFKLETPKASGNILKPTIVAEEKTTQEPERRSSSPERQYQGVGRLIDQWQRKTADVEAGRPAVGNKRPSLAPKRAGLVNGKS